MRSTSIGIGTFVLLSACAEPPAAPVRSVPTAARLAVGIVENGAVVERTREERSFSGLGFACDGEPVAVEVRYVTREQIVFPPSGGVRHTVHVLVRARGTGLNSGVRYIGQLNEIEVFVYRRSEGGVEPRSDANREPPGPPPPMTRTSILRLREVTQGPAANNFVTLHVKLTVNANGVLTVAFRKGEGECGGPVS